jgi:hypothetical protein
MKIRHLYATVVLSVLTGFSGNHVVKCLKAEKTSFQNPTNQVTNTPKPENLSTPKYRQSKNASQAVAVSNGGVNFSSFEPVVGSPLFEKIQDEEVANKVKLSPTKLSKPANEKKNKVNYDPNFYFPLPKK